MSAVVVAAWWPTRWVLWRLRTPEKAYVLGWTVAAAAVAGWSLSQQHTRSGQVLDLVVLVVLAVGYDELSRRIEQARLGVARGPHVSMRSVWAVVGATELPLALFAVLAAAIYVHASVVSARARTAVGAYRSVFNAATMVASAAPAAAVLELRHALPPGTAGATGLVAVVAAAALAYFGVNTVAVAGWFAIRRGHPEPGDLGTWPENLLELGTLGIGAACAVSGSVWSVLLTVPVMYLLQRSALVDELETAATQDPKTGLLNASAWQATAEQELRRAHQAGRPLAVLVVDIDHFKAVNDRYGHLAGDTVLTGVATLLTGTLRDRDRVGRFGGEEFVAVLPALHVGDATTAAERVRAAIAAHLHDVAEAAHPVQVTASIGVAAAPVNGHTVAALLAAADRAMYAAKQAGRDRVVAAEDPGEPANRR